jgi:hypothetical protein
MEPDIVSFAVTPELRKELMKMSEYTGMHDHEIFQKAFTLFRTHVYAAREGDVITIARPGRRVERIELPFSVRWNE